MCIKREESANQMRKRILFHLFFFHLFQNKEKNEDGVGAGCVHTGPGLGNGKEDAQHKISTYEMRTTNRMVSTTSDYQTHRAIPRILNACLEKVR
jgi:hypothetical protein